MGFVAEILLHYALIGILSYMVGDLSARASNAKSIDTFDPGPTVPFWMYVIGWPYIVYKAICED